ncbi:MAG: hypothetical protein NZO16_06415 [Deltaproteobacteria bacterium]|nr:hypothetical protein [Deltaproteobacteria bacterium]
MPLRFGRVFWLATYQACIHAIKKFKFERVYKLHTYLSDLVLKNLEDLETKYDCIALAPINYESFIIRGFNHLELIFKSLSEKLACPIIQPFGKLKNKTQLSIYLTYNFDHETLLFVDDVITTGETFIRCLKVLPKTVKKVDSFFLSVSKPNVFNSAILRSRLIQSWQKRKF